MNQAFSAQGPVPVWAQAAYAATSTNNNAISQLGISAGLPGAPSSMGGAA